MTPPTRRGLRVPRRSRATAHARRAVLDDAARRRRDPDVHARGDAGQREDARPGRGRLDRRAHRPRQHVPPDAPPRRRGHRRASAACTRSRAGRTRCSPTPAASRRYSLVGAGAASRGRRSSRRARRASRSSRTSTARSTADARERRARAGRSSAPTSRCSSTSARPATRRATSSRRPSRGRRAGRGARSRPPRPAGAGALRDRAGGAASPIFAAPTPTSSARSPFDGLALGGFSVGEPIERMHETLARGRPRARPRAPSLPDGRRHAARPRPRHRRRRRHVRLRPADAQRAQRPGAHPVRSRRHQAGALARTTRAPSTRRAPAPAAPAGYSRAYLRHLYLAGEILCSAPPVAPQPALLRRARRRARAPPSTRGAYARAGRARTSLSGMASGAPPVGVASEPSSRGTYSERLHVQRREAAARQDPAPAQARVAAGARRRAPRAEALADAGAARVAARRRRHGRRGRRAARALRAARRPRHRPHAGRDRARAPRRRAARGRRDATGSCPSSCGATASSSRWPTRTTSASSTSSSS